MTTIDNPLDSIQQAAQQEQAASAVEEISGRVFMAGLGQLELTTVYLGVRLGLYRALDLAGAQTPRELAAVLGLDQRYVQEWLQSQAVSGFATADGDDPATARYRLAPGVRETLVDETNPAYIGGLGGLTPALGRAIPLLTEAFRTGAGVPMSAYGPEAVEAQGALNRPAYVNSLVQEWLPVIPDVQVRLADETRPARVADVGCGVGWSAIELAKVYPHLRVDGVDVDEESITRARRNAGEHGVAERVGFEVRDVSTPGALDGPYDLVNVFECLHDMAHPVEALRTIRAALAPGGSLLIMEENAAEEWTAPGDEIERFFATASLLWCVPQGRTDETADPVGPLMRPARLRQLAREAGFSGAEVLPIEHPFFRFYRLDA
jgi:2-polyprenyl-3-methyl-5-hydroxy-6-metoxy-1,4-benzoquinol methylase